MTPWVDFAVFWPFSLKIMRKLKFTTYHAGEGGVYQAHKIPSPSDLADWAKCCSIQGAVGQVVREGCGISRNGRGKTLGRGGREDEGGRDGMHGNGELVDKKLNKVRRVDA
eukprot:4367446-Amphidinium_carterae.1